MLPANEVIQSPLSPAPIVTGLKYFRSEIEAHINDHYCETNICEFELLKKKTHQPEPLKKAA